MNFSLTELHEAGSTAAYIARRHEFPSVNGTAGCLRDIPGLDEAILRKVIERKIPVPEQPDQVVESLAATGDWRPIVEDYKNAERLGNECANYLPLLGVHRYKQSQTEHLGECHRLRLVESPFDATRSILGLTKRKGRTATGYALELTHRYYSKGFHYSKNDLYHFPFVRGINIKNRFGDQGRLKYPEESGEIEHFHELVKRFGTEGGIQFQNPTLSIADFGNMLVDLQLSLLDAGYPHAVVPYRISMVLIDKGEKQKEDYQIRLALLTRSESWVGCHNRDGFNLPQVFVGASLRSDWSLLS